VWCLIHSSGAGSACVAHCQSAFRSVLSADGRRTNHRFVVNGHHEFGARLDVPHDTFLKESIICNYIIHIFD
jgi:hypothetical protein